VRTGRRALYVARQSVLAGMALSIAAMAVAAVGYLPPVAGALFQELIDLAVILNALRALRGWTQAFWSLQTLGIAGGDAIVDAELEQALADRDPLRGIAQVAARWAAAFVLEPAGATRTNTLGT
jgi:hypothetical protein